jgi:galactoside O-acetyltransferase
LLRGFSVGFLTTPDERLYLKIGERCMLNAAILFESREGKVEIGDRVYIGHGASIISRHGVSIGHDVTMAWGVSIYDHNSHSLDRHQRAHVVDHFYRTYGRPDCFDQLDWRDVRSAPIAIGDGVWIGFNAVVLKGVTIGEGAIVAACSVVTHDVEPYTVVAGNPAVFVRRLPNLAAEASPSDSP